MDRGQGGRTGGIRVELTAGEPGASGEETPETATKAPSVGPETPFGILLVGDFRGVGDGAEANDLPPLERRTPLQIDRDDLDQAIQALAPRLRPGGSDDAPAIRLEFRELADFHPDRLLQRVPLLRAILEGSDDVDGVAGEGSAEASGAGDPSAGVLDRILAEQPEAPGEPGGSGDPVEAARNLQEYVRRITRPHEVDEPAPGEAARAAARQRAVDEGLRVLLHDPRFQALEAHWRGAALLVDRLSTGTDLKVFLLQATPAEISGAVAEGSLTAVLAESARSRLGGAAPWAVVGIPHGFTSSGRDLQAIQGLSRVGARLGTAVVAEADPSLLTAELDTEGWQNLREAEAARHLALALPRFLLRLPYAEGENPTEEVEFQELEPGSSPDPQRLLWGSPTFLLTLLLGQSFRERGWALGERPRIRVEGLPLALHRGTGGVEALPSTEALLDDGQVRAVVSAGIVPLVGSTEGTVVAMGGIRSLHTSGTALQGPWV